MSGPNDSLENRHAISLSDDMAGANISDVDYLDKLIPRRPIHEKFEPMKASLLAREKKWDDLKNYLDLSLSEETDDAINVFIGKEKRAIDLVKDLKYKNACSVLENEVSPMIQSSAPNHKSFIDSLSRQVKESMTLFEKEIVLDLIYGKKLAGLSSYLKAFFDAIGCNHGHPILALLLCELQLAEAAEHKDLNSIQRIFEKGITDIKRTTENVGFYMPSNFSKRIQDLEASTDPLIKFNAKFRESKINSLLDYMRLYFRASFRPGLDKDESFLQFTYQEDSDSRPHCMACGQVFPDKKGPRWFVYHITHSAECITQHISMCDGLTPCITEMIKKVKDDNSSGSVPGLLSATSHSSVQESEKRDKKRKMSAGATAGLRAGPCPPKMAKGDAVEMIGLISTESLKLHNDAFKQKEGVRDSLCAIICQQQPIVSRVHGLMFKRPVDSFAILKGISELQRKTFEVFSFANDLSPDFIDKIVAFGRLMLEFRNACAKPVCVTTVAPSAVCSEFVELVRLNVEINLMNKNAKDRPVDEVQKLFTEQNKEVSGLMKLVQDQTIDNKAIIDGISNITDINDRLLDIQKLLPAYMIPKLIDMYTILINLWCACFVENGSKPSDASQSQSTVG